MLLQKLWEIIGPMPQKSIRLKPSCFSCRALPPAMGPFSMTVTCQPSFAMNEAADNPAKPAPIISTDLLTCLFVSVGVYGRNVSGF